MFTAAIGFGAGVVLTVLLAAWYFRNAGWPG